MPAYRINPNPNEKIINQKFRQHMLKRNQRARLPHENLNPWNFMQGFIYITHREGNKYGWVLNNVEKFHWGLISYYHVKKYFNKV